MDAYGSPNTVWGMMNGLTEVSQEAEYASKRVAVDQAAARLATIDF